MLFCLWLYFFMSLSSDSKFFIGVIGVTIVILVGAVFFFSRPAKDVAPETLIPVEAWATGSATPKATLVEFSDFECPACGAAQPTVAKIVDTYKDELKFIYRHYPLDQHKNARIAAEAAEAAGAQGKFWEMHDVLFKNQTNLSKETINGLGIELKLDMDKFTQDVTAEKYKDKIEKDIADGTALGVNSTPTFFLNSKKLNLFSFTDLETEVKKALGK